jgi:predicted O-linked N-acetylglucosamine transferase (SPINDLY family)
MTILSSTFQDGIKALFDQGNYSGFTEFLEQEIQEKPEIMTNYWYLGLAYLLQGEEDAAQLVWLSAISEQDTRDAEDITQDLVQTLSAEANRLAQAKDLRNAWILCHHIHAFAPQNLNNLLFLTQLSIDLEEFVEESLEELGILDFLRQSIGCVDLNLLTSVFESILRFPSKQAVQFTQNCLSWSESPQEWVELVIAAAATSAFQKRLVFYATALTELCLERDPKHIVALGYLPRFYADEKRYAEAIKAAKNFYEQCVTPETQFFANCILLQVLMRAGDLTNIPTVSARHKTLISELIQNQSAQLSLYVIQFLIVNTGCFFYLQDDLKENRWLQNQAGQLFMKNIKANAPEAIKPTTFNLKNTEDRLKIGYIASTFKNHSVGWLCRWLFKYHDREKFEINAYLVQQRSDNTFFQTWFANQFDQVKFLPDDIGEATNIIRSDNLDILIDLDSITLDFTCTVMALKPAPIQVTWLGCDASGLPGIDYFIADPYVLPDNAQDHYQENVWRLPQTYIAVDGFESDVPSLRRSDLDIPEDAVIYWSSQVGPKRNPHMVRLQMKILKTVSKGYFLIKGSADQDIIQDFFIKVAEEEGVSSERLIFLPMMDNEYIHRANLQLADVALDTYPYNGATTTLEILWAGIPLVTRVGSTFSSRNSYAFLKNVGVEEGISWTDEEYIEWGTRLGQDEFLRQQVSWKLKQSRHTSPLWNAKLFTREMENAYRQMWAIHTSI